MSACQPEVKSAGVELKSVAVVIDGVDVEDMSSEQAMVLFERDQRPLYDAVREAIKSIDGRTDDVVRLQDEYARAATDADKSAVERATRSASDGVHQSIAQCRDALVRLQEQNAQFEQKFHDAANSASLDMRRNLFNACTRKLNVSMKRFQVQYDMHLTAVKDTQRRRLNLLVSTSTNPETKSVLTDAKINELIDNGHADAVIQEGAVSDELLECVNEIEKRHASVLALERCVRELFALFQEVDTLVAVQQNSIDIIAKHIDKTKDYAERGAKHLVEAEKHQTCARKGTCCIIIMVVIGFCVIFPVFFKGA